MCNKNIYACVYKYLSVRAYSGEYKLRTNFKKKFKKFAI